MIAKAASYSLFGAAITKVRARSKPMARIRMTPMDGAFSARLGRAGMRVEACARAYIED